MNDKALAPGGLALVEALVNTLDVETGADTLDTADGRAAFGLAEPDVPAARELREALRAACLAHAGHRAPGPSPAALDRLLADAPLLVTVADDGTAALRPAAPDRLVSRIAEALAAAAASGTWARLKACEAKDCRWAYYDRSPGGRRRWCSMSVCGARAKMRTYRARDRGASQSEPGLRPEPRASNADEA
ncbi:CGNR zinc finger domain-containing protein [Streptomyces lunaelactis]|uniref:CGNR zinc finger domain-containing protein n=1 Tax=Streptomyces lunaelactis TaxID=1535768 RepID=UPI00158495F0|nr:CGNR zinc finger domain-containing protein [Streptomyces lunaelactis]NUK05388.1 CGNR zinc finger domain-containing protein [Streptomyces lunaelactis]NUK19727.1 CGNR zinc finger domain-containing protein [Streptomyces lunaelactis]